MSDTTVSSRTGRALRDRVARLESGARLDGPAHLLGRVAGAVLAHPRAAAVLRGVPLGHPAHPLLTDLPIGFWTSASALDLLAPVAGRRAADRLVALGVLSALPTALSGLADWRSAGEDDEPVRRVGAVHAGLNVAGTALYGLSWCLRRRGHRPAGVLTAVVGAGVLSVSGYLGGHLASVRAAPGRDVLTPLPPTHEERADVTREAPAPTPAPVPGPGPTSGGAGRTMTHDHATIRAWVERQGGRPALVPARGPGEHGVPAVIFPAGPSGAGAEPCTWDEWFASFDANAYTFVHPTADCGPPFFELAAR